MSEEKTVDRKDIYMARCVLLLSAAVLALWLALGRGGEARTVRVEPVQAMSDFFTDRAALREDELDRLREIMADERAPEEIRLAAGRRELELMDRSQKEAAIEAVLSARGYAPLVVTVQSDSVNVLIEAESLERRDAQAILDLVMRETGVTGGNVKIIPIN